MAVTVKEERSQILNMISEGKISAEEGSRLLVAIKPPEPQSPQRKTSDTLRGRWLRIRVFNTVTGKPKVNVNLPMGLVSMGFKLGAQFAPEMAGFDVEELMAAIEDGAQGKILEVEDAEDGERVEIWLE